MYVNLVLGFRGSSDYFRVGVRVNFKGEIFFDLGFEDGQELGRDQGSGYYLVGYVGKVIIIREFFM